MSRSSEYEKGFMAGSKAQLAMWRSRFSGGADKAEVPLPELHDLNAWQQRALPFAVVVALVAGLILVGKFFAVIVLSLLTAIIFYPFYQRLNRRIGRPGTAAMVTFLVLLLAIIVPLAIAVSYTVAEVKHLIDQLSTASITFSLSEASNNLLTAINDILGKVTHGAVTISVDQLRDAVADFGSTLATWLLGFLTATFSGLASLVTNFILFLYIFTSLLVHAEKLKDIFRSINPLGKGVSDVYLARTARMTTGVVGGQFVIALCQGVAEAAVLAVAGIPYFFFFALVLTFLSIIPLGGGILAIPIGIILILSGNIWQGIFVLLMHFVVIVNIDNVLRPRLIPKSIRINSALMMLAVFGGLALFGFLGIAIGPIIMVLVITTLQMYLPMAQARNGATLENAQ